MNAAYYRQLARRLMANAAAATHPTIAARLKKWAQDYLLLAQAIDGTPHSSPPQQQPAQQQQQTQPKKQKDSDKPKDS